MYIKHLQLMNYRNYDELSLELGSSVNVFIGDNAQGKTNILESIYYCGFGKSHRTSKDRELIKWGAEKTFIKSYISKERLDKRIEINILKDGKKLININSIKITKIAELIGTFNVVMFSPEDLRIVKESPAIRRKFIDMELCQLDSKYYYSLVQYNKVLNERNIMLKTNNNPEEFMLDIYDEQLSTFAQYIINKRLEYIKKLNLYGKEVHKDITLNKEDINFKYYSQIKDFGNIKSQINDLLKENRKRDIEKRNTSIGPHRDDLYIYINGVEVKNYGSQGQQRTTVLTMKFSSLRIIKEQTGEYPVLLLDDVLSELDFNRKKYILNSIRDIQTIITCTGIDDVNQYLDSNSKIFNVKEGSIQI